jgi:hypothetical protein
MPCGTRANPLKNRELRSSPPCRNCPSGRICRTPKDAMVKAEEKVSLVFELLVFNLSRLTETG